MARTLPEEGRSDERNYMVWVARAIVLFGALLASLVWLVNRVIAPKLAFPDFYAQRSKAIDFVVFCLAVGALTMLLVQLYRFFVPIRGRFHRERIEKWLRVATEREEWRESARSAMKMFAMDVAMYDLPLEQLCAQLGTSAEQMLENPERFRKFLKALVGEDGLSDLNALGNDTLAAQGRLVRLIQRRIDAFQISTGAAWRLYLRKRVVWCSTGLGTVIALSGVGDWRSFALRYLLYGVLGGAMGGFLAMVFRDLVAIVELKRRA